MAERIGAVVITRDEAGNIGPCLDSLAFCDERVVVDSFSTDATVRLACERAEHVYRRAFVHHAEQKNWAAAQLRTEWVLVLDADERVPPELAHEIRERVESGAHDGWWIHRRNEFFGRFIRGAGWDRDRVLRLYRRDRGRYDDRRVHEEVAMDRGTTVGQCRNRIVHHSYVDWSSTFARFLSYSRAGAAERRRRGRSGSPRTMVTRPMARFLRQYLLQAGWRDGMHGLVLCQWASAGVFLREARLVLEGGGNEVVNRGPHSGASVERVKGRPPVDPRPADQAGLSGSGN